MDDGGGNGGGSFRVKHGSDAAEVTDAHEAEEHQLGEPIRPFCVGNYSLNNLKTVPKDAALHTF